MRCPYCQESIHEDAIVCRFCNAQRTHDGWTRQGSPHITAPAPIAPNPTTPVPPPTTPRTNPPHASTSNTSRQPRDAQRLLLGVFVTLGVTSAASIITYLLLVSSDEKNADRIAATTGTVAGLAGVVAAAAVTYWDAWSFNPTGQRVGRNTPAAWAVVVLLFAAIAIPDYLYHRVRLIGPSLRAGEPIGPVQRADGTGPPKMVGALIGLTSVALLVLTPWLSLMIARSAASGGQLNGAAAPIGSAPAATTHKVVGTLDAGFSWPSDSLSVVSRMDGQCQHGLGMDDLTTGSQVVLKDGHGTIIGSGSLSTPAPVLFKKPTTTIFGGGVYVITDCQFLFEFDDVPEVDQYQVFVGRDRGGVVFSLSDLKKQDWKVAVSLGL